MAGVVHGSSSSLSMAAAAAAVIWLLVLMSFVGPGEGVILSGAPGSFARYPKWAQTFENQLSLEFRTRSSAALLVYTDDGAVQGNFYALTIVDGRLQLDFRLGDSHQDTHGSRPVHTVRIEQPVVADGKWHKFVLFQAWENVKVQVDDTVVFKVLNQRSFVFGNLRTNSDVFVGGVPHTVADLGSMSSPLRRHTKPFAGTVKNLVYRLYPQGVSSPQMISSNGTRLTDDDYCLEGASPCLNGGRCYSTNEGPTCDCSDTDFDGVHCDKVVPAPALSFFGHEWIGYDVTNHTAAVVQNRYENVSIQFRTAHPNGLLFVAGDRSGYVELVLEHGVLIAISKLFGTEKRIIRMFNKARQPSRFDDDAWHEVVLFRDVHLMRLSADGISDEVKQLSADTEFLGNSFVYVGGAVLHRSYVPAFNQHFRGCMKKIRYEADAQLLNVIAVADQGFGQSVIRTDGDMFSTCQQGKLAPAPDVLSFNGGGSGVPLPKWNSAARGKLAFQFRTAEADALLLFHGNRRQRNATHGDYVAFELIDGHVFLVLNLGSGAVRLQATAQRVDDPRVWHSVQLERLGRSGTVTVDHVRTDFSTPGVSANLEVDEPLYVGGLPWGLFEVPLTVWSAQLLRPFQGCIKNVRVNGINSQIAKAFVDSIANSTLQNEISIGCPSLSGSDFCAAEPCLNGAVCRNGHTTFTCDCARTRFEGPRCNDEPAIFAFAKRPGDGPHLLLPSARVSQAEDVDIKFRTEDKRAVLLDTVAEGTEDRFRLSLDRGRLQLRLNINGSRHAFGWGEALNDNQWHTVRVQRRGDKLRLFVDGKWENHYSLPDSQTTLVYNEIAVAEPLKPYDGDSEESTENDDFDGDLIRASFNDIDLLDDVRQRHPPSSSEESTGNSGEAQRLKHRKVKPSTVWFDSTEGYLSFPVVRNQSRHGFKLTVKFRTLSADALVLLLWNEREPKGDFVSVQLVGGFLKMTRVRGTELGTAMIKGRRWNNLRWHTLHLHSLPDSGLRLFVENRTADVTGFNLPFETSGKLFMGGLPNERVWPEDIPPTGGFRGCMASLKVGGEPVDLWADADTGVQVEKGCRAPSNRCHASTCKNHGVCHQTWTSVTCDCSRTPFAGKTCEQLGTTYEFDGDGSCVYYEYPAVWRPSTTEDTLVLAFQTEHSNGVLAAVQCGVDGDFFTAYLGGGELHIKYNLGSVPHHVRLAEATVHDGRWHVLRIRRHAANLTVQLDDRLPVRYAPRDSLATLNTQWRVSVGASFNSLHSGGVSGNGNVRRRRRQHARVFDEFQGRIAGIAFNDLRILDAFAHGGDNTFSSGRPQLLHMAETPLPGSAIIYSHLEPGFFSAGSLDCASDDQLSADCVLDAETLSGAATSGFFTPVLASPTPSYYTSTTTLEPDPEPEPEESLVPSTTEVTTPPTTSTRRTTTIRTPEPRSRTPPSTRRTTTMTTKKPTTTTSPAPTHATAVAETTISGWDLHTLDDSDLPNAVRPTTPMGIPVTTGIAIAATDFPKTTFILLLSLVVIAAIAICLIWMFCCWKHKPNEKRPPLAGMAAGYAPIPCNGTPPQVHFHPSSQNPPLQQPPQTCTTTLVNGNGNGSAFNGTAGQYGNGHANGMVPHGNGDVMRRPEGGGMGNGSVITPLLPPASERRKDFKEWYV